MIGFEAIEEFLGFSSFRTMDQSNHSNSILVDLKENPLSSAVVAYK